MKLMLFTFIQFLADMAVVITRRFQLRPLQAIRVWAWQKATAEVLKNCNTRKTKITF